MASDDAPQVHTIAEQGDLLLEVGNPDKVRLLVSSQVLTAASKVFAALLGPNYLEGQTTRTSLSPQTIALPEDDAEDMTLVCQLLHGNIAPEQLDDMPDKALLGLAVHVDKYDLSQSLQFHCQALLLSALDSCKRSGPWIGTMTTVATAAYLMQRAQCFKTATRSLTAEATSSVDDPPTSASPAHGLLPPSVIDTIEIKRLKALDSIVFNVPYLLAPGCAACDFLVPPDLSRVLGAFGVKFWPAKRMAIQEAIASIQKLDGAPRVRCPRDHYYVNTHVEKADVDKLTQQLTDLCEGLCLRCVREGKILFKKCFDHQHRV